MLARVVFVRKNNLCVSQNFLADICELLIILSVGLKLCWLAEGKKLSNFSDVALPGRIMAANVGLSGLCWLGHIR